MTDFRGSYRDKGKNRMIPAPKNTRGMLMDFLRIFKPLVPLLFYTVLTGITVMLSGSVAWTITARYPGVWGFLLALVFCGVTGTGTFLGVGLMIKLRRSRHDVSE